MSEARIYVADLAAYNAGVLYGVWIDACSNIDDIWAEVKSMLAESPVVDSVAYSAQNDHSLRLKLIAFPSYAS